MRPAASLGTHLMPADEATPLVASQSWGRTSDASLHHHLLGGLSFAVAFVASLFSAWQWSLSCSGESAHAEDSGIVAVYFAIPTVIVWVVLKFPG